jgi:predicted transcriptional regulator
MAIQEKDKRLEIINYISETENSDLINAIHDFLKDYSETGDFWNHLSSKEKFKIKEGLEDIKEGRVTPHEKVKAKYGL